MVLRGISKARATWLAVHGFPDVGDEHGQRDVDVLDHVAEPVLREIGIPHDAKDAQNALRVRCPLPAVLDWAQGALIPPPRAHSCRCISTPGPPCADRTRGSC